MILLLHLVVLSSWNLVVLHIAAWSGWFYWCNGDLDEVLLFLRDALTIAFRGWVLLVMYSNLFSSFVGACTNSSWRVLLLIRCCNFRHFNHRWHLLAALCLSEVFCCWNFRWCHKRVRNSVGCMTEDLSLKILFFGQWSINHLLLLWINLISTFWHSCYRLSLSLRDYSWRVDICVLVTTLGASVKVARESRRLFCLILMRCLNLLVCLCTLVHLRFI